MGNCLVTKLKGVVDNPLLPKLDELHVPFKAGISGNIVLNGSSIAVACRMDGTVVQTYNNPGIIAFSADYDGFLRVKKTLVQVGLARMDLSNIKAIEFASCPIVGMFSVYSSGFSDSIENLVKYVPNATEYSLDHNNMTGNLEALLNEQGGLVTPNLHYLEVTQNINISAKRSTINILTNLLPDSGFLYEGITIIEDV